MSLDSFEKLMSQQNTGIYTVTDDSNYIMYLLEFMLYGKRQQDLAGKSSFVMCPLEGDTKQELKTAAYGAGTRLHSRCGIIVDFFFFFVFLVSQQDL